MNENNQELKEKIKSALSIEQTLEHYGVEKTSNNQYWCIIHEKGGKNTGHKTPSLIIHPNSQTVTCKSQGCFRGDDIFGVIAKMENLNLQQDFPKIIEKSAEIAGIDTKKAIISINTDFTPPTEEHQSYLKKRGIYEETIQLASLKSYQDKIIFPYKKNGEIVGYKAKTIYSKEQSKELKSKIPEWQPQFSRGTKHSVWGISKIFDKKIIYLVAGEYDLMTFYQELKAKGLDKDYGVITMTTGEQTSIKDNLIEGFKLLSNTEWRIVYDLDTTGRNAMPKRGQELLKTGRQVFSFDWQEKMNPNRKDGYDINDYFLEHGNIDVFLDPQNFAENIEGIEHIDVAEFEFLHPSLEIKDNIALFGFRALMKTGETENIFLIAESTKIRFTRDDILQIDNKEYHIDTRRRLLEPLNARWNCEEINQFIKNPIADENILFSINAIIKKYCELPNQTDYLILSAWIIGTYLFRTFWSFPFLHLKAPKRSGKSQTLDLLYKLCFNAKKARATLAALSDTVDSLRGTYIIDQADSLNNPTKEEILEILTDSYKAEGGKRRIIDFGGGRKERKILEFETYSPKAFASTKEIPEDLRDRCLIIPLIKSSLTFPAPNDYNENWKKLRGEIYKFTLLKFPEAQKIYQKILKDYHGNPQIVGRLAELWIPLETILTLCKADKQQTMKCKSLFIQRYGFSEYTPSEQEEAIMLAIRKKFNGKEIIKTTPKEIATEMDIKIDEDERKKLPPKIGLLIKKFNLIDESPKRCGSGMVYKLKKERVEKIFKSYFQQPETEDKPTLDYTKEKDSNFSDDFNVDWDS